MQMIVFLFHFIYFFWVQRDAPPKWTTGAVCPFYTAKNWALWMRATQKKKAVYSTNIRPELITLRKTETEPEQ